jgi:hypothetical protein
MYDIATKKYTTHVVDADGVVQESADLEGDMMETTVISTLLGSITNVVNLYSNVYTMVTSNPQMNVVMDKISESKTVFTLVVTETEDLVDCLTKVTFENGYMTEWEVVGMTESSGFNGAESMKITIEYNIANFELENIGSYTELIG